MAPKCDKMGECGSMRESTFENKKNLDFGSKHSEMIIEWRAYNELNAVNPCCFPCADQDIIEFKVSGAFHFIYCAHGQTSRWGFVQWEQEKDAALESCFQYEKNV